jgi:hypothetical protein
MTRAGPAPISGYSHTAVISSPSSVLQLVAPETAIRASEKWSAERRRRCARSWWKIGARIVRHGRYILYQLAEVAVSRALFAEILRRIERLRLTPPPIPA